MKHISARAFRFLVVFFMLLSVYSSRAQYVTIPDPVFAQWLTNNYPSCMVGDQLNTSCAAIGNTDTLAINNPAIMDVTGLEYFQNLSYLDCSGCSLTFLPPLSSGLTYLNCGSNLLDSLPQLPSGLAYLNCYGNQLTWLPSLPSSLTNLECGSNLLDSLPAITGTLTYLGCANNTLNSLPALPITIQTLMCYNNNISVMPTLPMALVMMNCSNQTSPLTIPAFPANLQTLNCNYCGLTGLPPFPNNLQQLYCEHNQLTSLPVLDARMSNLYCGYNQISSLPALTSAMYLFYCNNNRLSTLPSLPSGLLYLNCQSNQITALPNLPGSLLSLDCGVNQIVSLPNLPSNLSSLYCYDNPMDSLPAIPGALRILDCHNDNLTTIPTLPSAHFQYLWCDSNRITALPSLPAGLLTLMSSYNGQLTYIPSLPDTLTTFLCRNDTNLTCLPGLTRIGYLDFSNSPITCLPNYGTVHNSFPTLNSLPLCNSLSACTPFYNIAGNIFYDSSGNCTFRAGDVEQDYIKLQLTQGGVVQQQVYTGGQGSFSFQTPVIGMYTVLIDTAQLPFTISCPGLTIYTDTISTLSTSYSANNFALTCRTYGIDIGVTAVLNNYIAPRPTARIIINNIIGDLSQLYGAHCAMGDSGVVQIVYNGPANFAGPAAGALIPTRVIGDTLIWIVPDFGRINNNTAFNIIMSVDTFAVPGSFICLTATVSSGVHDYNPSNNSLSYCFPVVNALDPNEKEVSPTHIDSAGQWLTYTIRFQNTGTAPALNIRVTDTLDNNLDASTFQLLAYSAQNTTQLFGNAVVFNFPNINLPDSAASDSLSRGFVQYRVKTKNNIQPGAVVSNTAYIYFDLNSAVITNTVTDTVVQQQPCTRDTITQFGGLCAGDSVYFYGTYIHSPGTYDTLLTGGCDTVAILTLVVQDPLPPVYLFRSICSGDSFLFNGVYLDTSGTYTAHYNSLTACDSSVILRLTVNPLPVVTFTLDSLIANYDFGNSFMADSLWCSFSNPHNFVFKGGNPPGGVYSGYFVQNNTFQGDSVANLGWSYHSKDTITYTYADSNGCTAKASISVYLSNWCEGINEISLNSSISLYPNPATNQLFIKTENIQPQRITIYDVNGRVIYTLPFKPEVDINELSSGVYFVEVMSNEGVAMKRFVKM